MREIDNKTTIFTVLLRTHFLIIKVLYLCQHKLSFSLVKEKLEEIIVICSEIIKIGADSCLSMFVFFLVFAFCIFTVSGLFHVFSISFNM